MDEFDAAVTDQTNPYFYEDLEWEEDIEATETKEGLQYEASSSKGRSVSVFDRLGKKLAEHDLRLKLEKLTAGKKYKRS